VYLLDRYIKRYTYRYSWRYTNRDRCERGSREKFASTFGGTFTSNVLDLCFVKKEKKVFAVVEARGYVGNAKRCPSGWG
jgi:hypothetical protein